MSVVIGVDPHKQSHTAVAVHGRTSEYLAELTVPATDDGHTELITWGQALGSERRWAIENGRHVSGRLQHALLGAGEHVTPIPPKLMAGARRAGRARGKSDAIDARAIATAALREPQLPTAHLDEQAHDVKVLVDHREALVRERTRIQQRLRWHLHALGIEHDIPAGALDRRVWLERVSRRLRAVPQTATTRVLRSNLGRCKQATREINELERDITALIRDYCPALLNIPGCGPLTAAKLVAEMAGHQRFSSDAKLAMHAGVAPLPCSTGNTTRYRLNRSGNRQLNAAIHRIAITQGRFHEPARTYLARKQAEGKSRREALRCLKRHLARVVYNAVKTLKPVEVLT